MFDRINGLYQRDREGICRIVRSSDYAIHLIDGMFQCPVFDTSLMQELTDIPSATLNRYLKQLVERGILFTDEKKRNKLYFYFELLDLLEG